MNKILFIILTVLFSLSAQALFEVKDASDQTVLEVSNDGLRIFNEGDTLMVISSTEIKAFIDESAKDKALSRSFSVTTSAASGKGQSDVVNIAPDGLRVFSDNANLMDITTGNITAYIDTSYSFNVTSSDGGKLETDVLEVGAGATKMREGVDGYRYTDFSPFNIFLGLNAGASVTIGSPYSYSGKYNLFLGNESGFSTTSGYFNTFTGYQSGMANTEGTHNSFYGYQAGMNNQTSSYNSVYGYQAGYELNSGNNNSLFGYRAGYLTSTGTDNVFIGTNAGRFNSSGNYNIYVGNNAGYTNQSGSMNICIGQNAGQNTTSDLSVFLGTSAGLENTSGVSNTFIGNQAGANNSTGSFNTYLGWMAGVNHNGSNNTFIGDFSGMGNYSGNNNVYLGMWAGSNNSDGSGNVFIGYDTAVDGSNKLAIDNSNISTPLIYGDFSTNALTINGTLTTTSNATIGGYFTVNGNSVFNGTYFRLASNPGTGSLPTTYTYQGAASSTSKSLAFAIKDALWVTSNAYIDGTASIVGNTTIGGNVGMGTSAPGSHRLSVTGSNTGVAGVTGYFENTSTSDGIALHSKNTSSTNTALSLLVATAGAGDIARFDSWHGNSTWDAEFKFDNDGDGYCDRAWHGGGTDYAEYFPKANTGLSYEIGDIIMMSPNKSYTVEGADINNKNLLLGVFSSDPAVVGNSPAEDISHDNDVLVGLLGVIKTKVNTENGIIKIGDFITVSSSTKIGMKSTKTGMVIGRAMDNYNEVGVGMINVFVDAEWYCPVEGSEITDQETKNILKKQQSKIEELESEIKEIKRLLNK